MAPEDETVTEQLRELTGERNALLARREQIENVLINEDVDFSMHVRLLKKMEKQLSEIDETLRDLAASQDADPLAIELVDGTDFAQWWSGASVEDKRRLVRLLMEIHILPGKQGAKGFDPHRVKITWKQ